MDDKYLRGEELEAKAELFMAGKRKYFGTMISNVDIGVCKDCKHAAIRKTRYGKCFIYCKERDFFINTTDPIEVCTEHYPSGHMDLYDMNRMATIIDIDTQTKEDVGFLSKHKRTLKEEDEDE